MKPALDLLHRYIQVFRHAWRERPTAPPRARHETAFLPAALSLRETPVHPAPRIAMGLILLFAVIASAWAMFGRIDIVASAQGKLIPDSRSKVVQPLETAVVTAIHVREGQHVKAGELLIELDATQARADTTRLDEELEAARAEAARAKALLAAMVGAGLSNHRDAPTMHGRAAAERRLLEGEYAAYTHAQTSDEMGHDAARSVHHRFKA